MSQKSKRRKQPPGSAIAPIYRAYGLQPKSANDDTRTVEAVITTETPVMEWDWNQYRMIPRILLASGGEFPATGQVPLLDSHNRFVMENQLGSTRNLRKTASEVIGVLAFSSEANRQWTLVKEGHATDVSAGFQVLAETYIDSGKTQRIQGKDYTGPINIATKWRLYEVSLTPIGADEQAKLRGFDPNDIPQQDEELEMTPEQRSILLSRGMPETHDATQAFQWAIDNPVREAPKTGTEKGQTNPDDVFRQLDDAAQKREQERYVKRTAWVANVNEIVDLAGLPVEFGRQFHDCPEHNEVKLRTAIKAEKVERDKKGGVGFGNPRVTGEGRDEFRKDMLTHLVNRSFQQNGTRQDTIDKVFPKEIRGKDDGKWKYAKLTDIARHCLEMDGCDPNDLRHLPNTAIATAAMAGPQAIGLRTHGRRDSDDGPFHTTGSFAYLTENTLKKSLDAGYQDAPSSWEQIFAIGQAFTDFKPKKIYSLSEVGNLTVWPDGEKPDQSSMMDTKDSYGVEVYARSLSFSWQLLVNDDLNALTRAPAKLGAAARRTLNMYAWSLLTGNPLMRDGQRLLLETPAGNRKKSNYVQSGGSAPSVASIGVLKNLMRQQIGENTREGNSSPQILNLEPRYVVVPSALETTILQLLNSAYDPSTGVNNQVFNPARTLTPIIEPILDASSTQQWYMFCDKSQLETFELSYLAGHETPVVWSDMDVKTLTRWFAVRQGYGAKALHWQSVAANDGA